MEKEEKTRIYINNGDIYSINFLWKNSWNVFI